MKVYVCSCGAIRNRLAGCRTKGVEHEKLAVIEINDEAFKKKMELAPNNVFKTDLNAYIKTHRKHLVEVEEEVFENGDIKQ